VCSIRGHFAPAATAAHLRPSDVELGVDTDDGWRLSRCLRCDAWVRGAPPAAGDAEYDVVPPLSAMALPRRGKPLQDAILLRIIAIDRGVHSVVFGLLAIALLIIDTKLFDLQHWAQTMYDRLHGADVGPRASHDVLSDQLRRIGTLDRHTITVLGVTALVYCVVEGVEAVGLWLERRWAEYLTAVATAGFLPFEIHELLDHVTALRLGALIVNIAVLVYLVYAKHLFGVRGGPHTLREEIDWDAILAPRAKVS
jgi:uncharacterized membrane protein (DUF2068 family)